jgi:membrane protein DedA with SNARE-associated domain
MAGFTRLKFVPAVLYTSISIIGWNLLIFSLGKLAGENRNAIAKFISEYNHIASVVVLILAAVFIAWRLNLKSKKAESQISD